MTTITTPEALVLERRTSARDETPIVTIAESQRVLLLTPPISEEYWAYRVRVADGQAVVGFGKFGTIGIGFAVEEDWNTNLPYTSDAISIMRHIWHNRGENLPDTPEARALVAHAIELIRAAVKEDGGPQ